MRTRVFHQRGKRVAGRVRGALQILHLVHGHQTARGLNVDGHGLFDSLYLRRLGWLGSQAHFLQQPDQGIVLCKRDQAGQHH